MPKLLHKFLICFSIFSFLTFSPALFAQNDAQIQDIKENGQLNMVQNDIKVNDFDVEPINTNEVKNVVPDAQKEGRKVINLFLKVMGGVLLSAFILYIVLLLVKKYYGSAFAVEEYDEFENLNLSAPTSKEEALKSFLNRTK